MLLLPSLLVSTLGIFHCPPRWTLCVPSLCHSPDSSFLYSCKTEHLAVVILHASLPFCLQVCILSSSQGLLRGIVYSVPSLVPESSWSMHSLIWVSSTVLYLPQFVCGLPVYLVIFFSLYRRFLFTWQPTAGQLWMEKASKSVIHETIPNSRNPSSSMLSLCLTVFFYSAYASFELSISFPAPLQ